MSIKIYFLLFCSMLAVSTSPLIARHLDNMVGPISIAFWRMLLGTIILTVYGYFTHNIKLISSKNFLKTVLAGILLGLHFALFYGAISLLPDNIPNATVFGTLAPLFALFIEIYFGRKIDKKIYFGLSIILCGSFLIFIDNFSFNSDLTNGNILAILCSVCFACVFIISEQVRRTDSALSFSRSIFFYASITLLIIGFFMDISFLNDKVFHNFHYLIFLGIVPTLIGHSVFYYLVKYLPPTAVASIPLGEPFIASTLAWVIFPGQIFNIYIICGGLMTLIGLFVIIQSKKT